MDTYESKATRKKVIGELNQAFLIANSTLPLTKKKSWY